MRFRMTRDEFWFGIVEEDIVVFFYRLDVTITKSVLAMKFWPYEKLLLADLGKNIEIGPSKIKNANPRISRV